MSDATDTVGEPTAEGTWEGGLSDQVAFYISAAFGLALAVSSTWFVGEQMVWYEALNRVRPTVSGGGVGAGWEAGLEQVVLNAAIDLIHFADLVMGAFILVVMFTHWAAFHRLGSRMKPPASQRTDPDPTIADGGEGDE